jgi:hypothetical protein
VRRKSEALTLVNLGLGLGTLTQLYPLYDEVHLWFIAPVLIVCSAIGLRSVIISNAVVNRCAIFFLPPVIILASTVVQDWNQPRVKFESPVLNGMMGNPDSVRNLDQTLIMMNRELGSSKITFDCPHGLYAVHNGSFASTNPFYVNWAPGFEVPSPGQKYFVCDLPESLFRKYQGNSKIIAKTSYVLNETVFYSAILVFR